MRNQTNRFRIAIFLPCLAMCIGTLWTAPARADDPVAKVYYDSYSLEAQRKYKQALKAIKRVPKAKQKSYFYQLRLGWLAYLAGSLNDSIAAYNKAVALEPRAVEPLLGLVLPQMAARRWKDAETTARKVLRMAPTNDGAAKNLAWVLYNLGRYAESERMYRRVLGRHPGNLNMHTGLGWALVKQGKKDEAKKVFSFVLSVSPKNYLASTGLKAIDG